MQKYTKINDCSSWTLKNDFTINKRSADDYLKDITNLLFKSLANYNLMEAMAGLHQCSIFYRDFLDEVVKLLSFDKELSFENIELLKNLKANLIHLTKFLDEIFLRYSKFGKKKSSIEGVVEDKESAFYYPNLPEIDYLVDLKLTPEEVLCSHLGLREELADRLTDISDHMREHKSEKVHLLIFLGDKKEIIENLRESNAVAETLCNMGFTKHRSQVIANWIRSMPDPNCRSIFSWVETYIENHFKYDIFLNDQFLDFPYKNDHLNEWFTEYVSQFDDEGDLVEYPVNIINVESQEDALRNVESKVAEKGISDPKVNIYFHVTDHIGAQNILEDTIKLHNGLERSDFSDGLYLSNNPSFSLEQYATSSSHPAIIMFDVDPNKLSEFKGIDLSSDEKNEEWKSIVQYFRSGRQKSMNLSKSLQSQIKKCDYIKGPVYLDDTSLSYASFKDVEQICIKERQLAQLIGCPLSIVGVVFFKLSSAWLNVP